MSRTQFPFVFQTSLSLGERGREIWGATSQGLLDPRVAFRATSFSLFRFFVYVLCFISYYYTHSASCPLHVKPRLPSSPTSFSKKNKKHEGRGRSLNARQTRVASRAPMCTPSHGGRTEKKRKKNKEQTKAAHTHTYTYYYLSKFASLFA
jgi:hypothetical protein